jgi:SAM-dependent methyltransferase
MINSLKTFRSYSKYYDLFYQKKNYKKEVDCIIKLLKKFKFKKKELLEFGSGTGNHAEFFVKKGYKVHGIEKSKNMIALSKKINGFTCQHGDICKIKLKKKYDIVLSLFHVINYQNNKKNLNDFFKNARYHLKPKSILGFDFWYTPAVNFQKPKIRLSEFKNKNLRIIKLAEPEIIKQKNIVNVKYTIIMNNFFKKTTEVVRENHRMKHFSLNDLEKAFKKYKFRYIYSRELISNKKPSKNTWGVFCLLQKY